MPIQNQMLATGSALPALKVFLGLNLCSATQLSPGCFSSVDLPHSALDQWSEKVSFGGSEYTHRYSLPGIYSHDDEDPAPVPLLLFFHGWGGDSSDCSSTCREASDRGYATVSLTGIGSEYGELNSWNGFGSTQSSTNSAPALEMNAPEVICGAPEENDRTCNVDAYEVGCYEDCSERCADGCWWTTCKDSVQQTVVVLESFLNTYCIDLHRIYASGCSNGAMFVYELAHDSRTAKYLAGIAPQVGLPHYGYNKGPNKDYLPIHHIGFWGLDDATVPPIQGRSSGTGCEVECRTSESQGWFFTSSACVTAKWGDVLGLNHHSETKVMAHEDYDIPFYDELEECWSYTGSNEGGAIVIGCYFNGGHDCNLDYMNAIIINFFDENTKESPPTNESTDSPIATTSIRPSYVPTSNEPTIVPTEISSSLPSAAPTIVEPTSLQLNISSSQPSWLPTSNEPTFAPTAIQSGQPSDVSAIIAEPTGFPSATSSSMPSNAPRTSEVSTVLPSAPPTIETTNLPTNEFSNIPSNTPSMQPADSRNRSIPPSSFSQNLVPAASEMPVATTFPSKPEVSDSIASEQYPTQLPSTTIIEGTENLVSSISDARASDQITPNNIWWMMLFFLFCL
mmetsp:Transcript_24482/g.48810  ORF Transcript_24482/g.48810 Transcript_24482/m.48810 type:complete len:622 (+) Transcript_24482:134-1999(+)